MRGHTTILYCDNDLNLLTRLWPYMNILKLCVFQRSIAKKVIKIFYLSGGKEGKEEAKKECLKEEKQHTKSASAKR